MAPRYQDSHITLYNKNFLDNDLPDESVQMVVTSPPYFGLRKYDGEQEITWSDGGICAFGMEKTPELYVAHSIEILREVRRVLRPDGVVFWNVGDSYVGGGRGQDKKYGAGRDSEVCPTNFIAACGNLKPKDLCLIPFRVAIAAQEDGWWVRSDIIWAKPNPMPESVRDRPTNSHEYIFMLTKSSKYYWDQEAVREPAQDWGTRCRSNMRNGTTDPLLKHHGLTDANNAETGRNIRSVWAIPTQPFSGTHFAVFPEKLPETCIKAATPEVGCCSQCGAPWVRIIERTGHVNKRETAHAPKSGPTKTDSTGWAPVSKGTDQWQPGCKCNAEKTQSVVLDPFAGSGTSLWVAKKLGRRAIGFEISEQYCQMIIDRNRQQGLI